MSFNTSSMIKKILLLYCKLGLHAWMTERVVKYRIHRKKEMFGVNGPIIYENRTIEKKCCVFCHKEKQTRYITFSNEKME